MTSTIPRLRWRSAIPGRSVPLALLFSLLISLSFSTATLAASHQTVATDGPGALSYFDLARKDCVGTARNTNSKVWFTLADGVLSDVYYPTIDNTNVKTLQYMVTDGSTFTDLQTRDTTYTVQSLDKHALDCRVTTTAKSGKYSIVTDYLTDPSRNSVAMHVSFKPLIGKVSDYKLYVRFDPTLNGNGGGSGNGGADAALTDTSSGHPLPVAYDTNTKTNAINRTYAVPVYSALAASSPFLQVSSGFVGQPSDGQVQLDSTHALANLYDEADNGNVVQTAQIDLAHSKNFTLALGFATKQSDAVATVRETANASFDDMQQRYEGQWHDYDRNLIAPPSHFNGVTQKQWQSLVDEYYLSANVIRASQDKTFAGAEVASLASPWGQAVSAGDPNNTYFGSYREVFARDLYEAWTGFYLDGDIQSARNLTNFLFQKQQQADGSMPRNSLLNGQIAPDSFNTQLDEASYPIIMAYQLHMNDRTL